MEIKSFRANTLRRALKQVQQELGPDASILRTRELWDGWIGGLMGKRRVEVFASQAAGRTETADESINVSQAKEVLPTTAGFEPSLPSPTGPLPIPFPPTVDFDEQMQSLRATSDSVAGSTAQFKLFTELLEAEWSDSEARRMVTQAADETSGSSDIIQLRDAVYRSISEVVKTHGPIQLTKGNCRVVALVGPTGVGKTTTIAKLAANFRLREKKRVALVTVDTYRIAAVEQLRTYADIIDLPMHVVSNPTEMRTTMEGLSDYDLVLLDTAGRSPHDEIRIQELQGILGAAGADEVHLVLSTNAGARSLRRTAEKFSEVGLTALLLTKLDECSGLGEVLPLLEECDLPVSYVTNGQNVPDDIQDARVADLPNSIMGVHAAA